MLSNTRVTGIPDVSRLGEALARPGMDTRVWHCLAFVEKVVIDPNEGIFLDVICSPNEDKETARLATIYNGPGFGFYFPVEEGDEVLVWAPNGDPNEGLVAMPKMHSPSDPPPPGIEDNPLDVLLYIKEGQNLNITTSGGGNVNITVNDGGAIRLGSEASSESLVLGQQWQSLMADILNTLLTHVHLFPAPIGAPTTPPAPPALAEFAAQLAQVQSGVHLSTKAFTE